MKHYCHAGGCKATIVPEIFMCPDHLRLVPETIRRRLNAYFKDGQGEEGKPAPDPKWLAAAMEAQKVVREKLTRFSPTEAQ